MNWFQLSSLLDRPIAFHRIFATIGGGACAGIFLSQLFYWADKGKDPDGWIYKSQEEWEEETALTRREQQHIRKELQARGLLEEKKEGLPCRIYYRINQDALLAALEGSFRELTLEEILSFYKVELGQLSKAAFARAARCEAEREFVNYAQLLKDNGAVCHLCNGAITRGCGQSEGALHFDHIIPLCKGGAHTYNNIKPCHAFCNLSKGTKNAETLDTVQFAYSKKTSLLTVNKLDCLPKENQLAYSKKTSLLTVNKLDIYTENTYRDYSETTVVAAPKTEPTIEVEILSPSQEGQAVKPEANTEALHEQEVQTQAISPQSEATQEDTFPAAADPEILKEIERVAHNWKLRPWRESAQRFKPDMIRAVWQCNPGYYSLQGTRTPNQHHILKALQLLERQLKSLDAAAINAYYELKRYWQTAQALANPNVQHAFVAAAAQSKEQVEAMERQRQAQIDAERLRKDLGL